MTKNESHKITSVAGWLSEFPSLPTEYKKQLKELEVNIKATHPPLINISLLMIICPNLQKLSLKGVRIKVEKKGLYWQKHKSLKDITVESLESDLQEFLDECCETADLYTFMKMNGQSCQMPVPRTRPSKELSESLHGFPNTYQHFKDLTAYGYSLETTHKLYVRSEDFWKEMTAAETGLRCLDIIAKQLPALKEIEVSNVNDEEDMHMHFERVKNIFGRIGSLKEILTPLLSVIVQESKQYGGQNECIISCERYTESEGPAPEQFYNLVNLFKGVAQLSILVPKFSIDLKKALKEHGQLKYFILDASELKYQTASPATSYDLTKVIIDVAGCTKDSLRSFIKSCPNLHMPEKLVTKDVYLELEAQKEKSDIKKTNGKDPTVKKDTPDASSREREEQKVTATKVITNVEKQDTQKINEKKENKTKEKAAPLTSKKVEDKNKKNPPQPTGKATEKLVIPEKEEQKVVSVAEEPLTSSAAEKKKEKVVPQTNKKVKDLAAAPVAEKKVVAQVEEQPAPVAEKKVVAQVEEQPAPVAEKKVVPQVVEQPAPVAEKKVVTQLEEQPAPVAEKKVVAQVEEQPAPVAEKKVVAQVEEQPAPVAEKKVVTQLEEQPAPAAEKKAVPQVEEQPAPHITNHMEEKLVSNARDESVAPAAKNEKEKTAPSATERDEAQRVVSVDEKKENVETEKSAAHAQVEKKEEEPAKTTGTPATPKKSTDSTAKTSSKDEGYATSDDETWNSGKKATADSCDEDTWQPKKVLVDKNKDTFKHSGATKHSDSKPPAKTKQSKKPKKKQGQKAS